MSSDLSELIALGCPDLMPSESNAKVVELGGNRRLSIKQMTATGLAAERAIAEAARIETETALAQAVEQIEARTNNSQTTLNTSSSVIPPPPRSRITSLPNIMHINELVEYESEADEIDEAENQQPQLELIANESSQTSGGQATALNDDLETAATNEESCCDSIERLRQQRLNTATTNDRQRRSRTPLLHHRDRSAAPERLHSASQISLNMSRRESDVSSNDENNICTTATVLMKSPPKYPLVKTNSTPNIERRRSSLANIFPGASPLVAPEPILHTVPKANKNNDNDELSINDIKKIVENNLDREIPTGKMIHRTKTPPPVGVKLGVNLKRVSPPKTHITVKKNEGPMLGVVLRKVEKKVVEQKSILDDDKPLYQLSIVRSDNKDHKPAPKPKPKATPVGIQKSATATALAKPNSGGILTGPTQQTKPTVQSTSQQAYNQKQQMAKTQRPQYGVPITIQKIEGDKIIIIKKIVIPKNSKIPEQYLKVRMFSDVLVL